MRNRYTINYSDEDYDLARDIITGFFKNLGERPPAAHDAATIAISRTEIAWGEFGFDTSDKIALVLNIQVLSKGRLKTLVAKELRFLLFNDSASEKVTHAMMNALAWVADIERRGINAINERNVLGFFAEISDTFVGSLEKYLDRNRPD